MAPALFLLMAVGQMLAPGAAAEPMFGALRGRSTAVCGKDSVRVNKMCPPGSCCSGAGYCGTTSPYCQGDGCQLEYSDSCDAAFGPQGADTDSIPRPKFGSVPYGDMITECVKPGLVALTYDDGPYLYTSELLDLLDRLNATATFFVSGNNKGKGHIDNATTPWPELLRRMLRTGHQIAGHTWTHRDMSKITPAVRRTEMMYTEMALRNVFGWIPTYMRPPYLSCSADCVRFLADWGYHVISTNLDTKDYVYNTPATVAQAKKRFSDGVSNQAASHQYIVLAHDIQQQTVVSLTEYMVNTARERGYRLVTVGECLGDPPENWYRCPDQGRACGPSAPASVPTGSGSGSTSASTSTSATSTSPAQTSSALAISNTGRCGKSYGFTCQGSRYGNCCSSYGFCGKTPAHCTQGCDPAFGTCDATTATGVVAVSTNGRCGSGFQAKCLSDGPKPCCSRYGFCGSGAPYCGTGCQKDFGCCNELTSN